MINRSLLACLLLILAGLQGCTTTYTNQSPVGELFPSVKGTSLSDKEYDIPEQFKGQPVLFLIGYKQASQFDIDRWLIGLDMTETKVATYELPAIQGFVPRLFSRQIDSGMRAGIPDELWRAVITIYEDGDRVQQFTGNTNPNNARCVLLDADSRIVYFYDRGFSVAALNELKAALSKLGPQS
ncbi:MAG: hypothetical protein MI867_16315 [Pseudomonadales bacterium]|nr:hypothetical protein [Pseudomonadales bacterium]